MADFPFDSCPTAWDLRSFSSGLLDPLELDLAEHIRAHLAQCSECTAAMARLSTEREERDAENSARDFAVANAPESHARQLTRQRRELERLLGATPIAPDVGEIWSTAVTEEPSATFFYGPLPLPVVVLRVLDRPPIGEAVVDAAFVTHEDRWAADWSLIFKAEHSGVGVPAVIHIDHQLSMRRSMLKRRLGRLPAQARGDLLASLDAYARSAGPRLQAGAVSVTRDLEVGRVGETLVRIRPEWTALSDRMFALSQRLALGWEEEDRKRGQGWTFKPFGTDEEPQVQLRTGLRLRLGDEEYTLEPSESDPDVLVVGQLRSAGGQLKPRDLLSSWERAGEPGSGGQILCIEGGAKAIHVLLQAFQDLRQPENYASLALAASQQSSPEEAPRAILRVEVEGVGAIEILEDGERVYLRLIE